jgi:hypothetical protein
LKVEVGSCFATTAVEICSMAASVKPSWTSFPEVGLPSALSSERVAMISYEIISRLHPPSLRGKKAMIPTGKKEH